MMNSRNLEPGIFKFVVIGGNEGLLLLCIIPGIFSFSILNSFLFYSAELKVDMDGLAAYAKNVFIRVIL